MSKILCLDPCKRCGSPVDHSPLYCPESIFYGKDPAEVVTVCGDTNGDLAANKGLAGEGMHAASQYAYWPMVSCTRRKAARIVKAA